MHVITLLFSIPITQFTFVTMYVSCYFFVPSIQIPQVHRQIPKGFSSQYLTITSPVGWGCWICRLHHCTGERHPPKIFLDMILSNQMMRLQSSSFGVCGVTLYCHYSTGPFWPETVVTFRVLSMGQIELVPWVFSKLHLMVGLHSWNFV